MDRQEKRKNEGTADNASDETPDNSDIEEKVSYLQKVICTEPSRNKFLKPAGSKISKKLEKLFN